MAQAGKCKNVHWWSVLSQHKDYGKAGEWLVSAWKRKILQLERLLRLESLLSSVCWYVLHFWWDLSWNFKRISCEEEDINQFLAFWCIEMWHCKCGGRSMYLMENTGRWRTLNCHLWSIMNYGHYVLVEQQYMGRFHRPKPLEKPAINPGLLHLEFFYSSVSTFLHSILQRCLCTVYRLWEDIGGGHCGTWNYPYVFSIGYKYICLHSKFDDHYYSVYLSIDDQFCFVH